MVVVWSVLILLIFILAASYVCCRLCFSVPKQTEADLFRLPDTEQYAPHREAMTQMVRTVLALPYEDVWIRSDDGLRLHGKYYAGRPDAPVQIMMHGYKAARSGTSAAGRRSPFRAAVTCCWSISVRMGRVRAGASRLAFRSAMTAARG